MIKAEHKYWAELPFRIYIDHLLKKQFGRFILINSFPKISSGDGLLITPNHFSWWDGFFIDFALRKLSNRKIYLMMLERQLNKYWFFRKVGAFSVDAGNPKSAASSLRYARKIISDPGNVLIVYPQGELVPYGRYPFHLKHGIGAIVRDTKINIKILPAAFKINYGDDKKPFVSARFGNVISPEVLLNDFNYYAKEFENNVKDLDKSDYSQTYTNLFER